MSLTKTVHVACDGSDLLMTRLYIEFNSSVDYSDVLRASREERRELTMGCAYSAPTAFNAKEARQKANEAGWVRHRETVRKYSGTDEVESRSFDLCPSCAPKVVQS